ncbi:plasmid mobilization protein [Desulfonatronum parangueonense]
MAKSERMHLRFSPEDKVLVRQKAEMAGMSVSELVRSILHKRQIRSHLDIRVEQQKIVELNRVGVLLNQIAKYANTYAEDADAGKILDGLLRIESLINGRA